MSSNAAFACAMSAMLAMCSASLLMSTAYAWTSTHSSQERGVALESTMPASGDGFLRSAGAFSVEILDRSKRRETTALNSPNKFLLHTLEIDKDCGSWELGNAGLDKSGYWPHFIVAKDRSGKVRIGQFLPLNVAGFALARYNELGAVQVEIGAQAKFPFTHYKPEITAAVGALWAELNRVTQGGIPISVDPRVQFRRVSELKRLTVEEFEAVGGLCGHQHVPLETHWDPGAIVPSTIIATAEASLEASASAPPSGGESESVNSRLVGDHHVPR